MTKAELISAVAEKSGFSKKDSEKALNAVVGSITDALVSGDKVQIVGFGTFEVRVRKGRAKARNPKTGEVVAVEKHGVAIFRPGKELKDFVWDITDGEEE